MPPGKPAAGLKGSCVFGLEAAWLPFEVLLCCFQEHRPAHAIGVWPGARWAHLEVQPAPGCPCRANSHPLLPFES